MDRDVYAVPPDNLLSALMNTIAENKIVEKYPNYEKLAQYLNTLENPQRILRTVVVLCERLRNDEKDN